MIIMNVGMPRSGTLWRYKLIRDLVIASGGKDGVQIRNKYFLQPFIGLPNADLNTITAKRLLPASIPSILGESYVLNSHAGPTNFSQYLIKTGNMKVIYGFRDPRDCILSILEYSGRALPQYSASFLKVQTVEDAIKFMEVYLEIWEGWRETENTLILRYEDMIENYDSCIERIISYLDLKLPGSKLSLIKSIYLPKQKPKEGVKIHFEHGKVNRFRDNFNQNELETLNNSYQQLLIKMGYEI